ncbi:MAG: hypothetical protein ABIB43_03485 [archaeon]
MNEIKSLGLAFLSVFCLTSFSPDIEFSKSKLLSDEELLKYHPSISEIVDEIIISANNSDVNLEKEGFSWNSVNPFVGPVDFFYFQTVSTPVFEEGEYLTTIFEIENLDLSALVNENFDELNWNNKYVALIDGGQYYPDGFPDLVLVNDKSNPVENILEMKMLSYGLDSAMTAEIDAIYHNILKIDYTLNKASILFDD